LLNQKYYLAAGVAAAFECKVTLRADDIRSAVENATIIRRLVPERTGSPYKELQSPIIYGLLAHSHEWRRAKSKPVVNIERDLWQADLQYTKHPREMLDMLCVADLAFWNVYKMPWLGPGMLPVWDDTLIQLYGLEGSAITGHFCVVT